VWTKKLKGFWFVIDPSFDFFGFPFPLLFFGMISAFASSDSEVTAPLFVGLPSFEKAS